MLLKRILLGSVFISQFVYSYINIYPTKFEKDVTNGAQESFKLYNRTEKIVRYRIYIEKLENEKIDMYDWIEIYPRSISLRPLEEKEIRLSIIPKRKPKNGTYKGKIVIKEVGIPGEITGKKVDFMTMIIFNITGYITTKK